MAKSTKDGIPLKNTLLINKHLHNIQNFLTYFRLTIGATELSPKHIIPNKTVKVIPKKFTFYS